MTVLPIGWAQAHLPEMLTSEGIFTDGDWVESKDQDPDGEVRLIQLADVGPGSYRNRSARFLTLSKAEQLGCTVLQPEDLLIARMPEPLGRACLFPGDSKVSVTVVDVCVVRPGSGGVNPRWLMYALNAPQARRAMVPFEKGTTRKRISRTNLARIPLPVPPIHEQERIVNAIEEQFSRLDAGTDGLDRARERLRHLRDDGLLALVQASADLQPLGEVSEIRLGRQRSPKNHTGPRLRPYLRAANVTWSGLDLRDVKLMNFSSSESSIYELRPGDVLVAEASGSASEVGKPAIWDGSIAHCCFQNTLLRVRSDRFLPEYLFFVLLAHARSGTFARASRGVGIHHLSKSGLSELGVVVPALAEQEAIAKRARSLQVAVGRLLDEVEKQSARVRTLRSAILSAAFSGELVHQDPSDEPATSLLERIAAQGATSNGHKTPRALLSRTTRRKVSA